MPDEGNIEWCNRITTGYLDQYSVLTQGKTIREILREAFQYMFDLEKEMLEIYDKMGSASDKELEAMMEDVGEIQNTLEHNGFYILDSKIDEVANGLGLNEIGLDKTVENLSGGQRAKVLLTKLLLQYSHRQKQNRPKEVPLLRFLSRRKSADRDRKRI